MKISVITPTVRKNGIPIIASSLRKQTFRDFEWLIGCNFNPGELSVPYTLVLDDFRDGYWSLNRIYNKLFRAASGELIVSWQDWIYANPDGLEKFWTNYEETKGVISGVGDQYESTDKFNRPQIKIWSDPRKTNRFGSFYECYPNDCEWNYAAIPKAAIMAVGGMDEELDFKGFGGDQLQACARMDDAGFKFYIDQTNESFTIRHGREIAGGEDNWNAHHVLFNGEYDKRIAELKKEGRWPDVKYLQQVRQQRA